MTENSLLGQMFETLLNTQFQKRPGEDNVRTGSFCLFSDKAQSRLVKKEDWSRVVFPGTRLLMSMILLSVSVFDEMCPRGCDMPGKKIQKSTSVVWWVKLLRLLNSAFIADPLQS